MSENNQKRISIRQNGCIDHVVFSENGEDVQVDFLKDSMYSGPRWYGVWDDREQFIELVKKENDAFQGEKDDILFSIEYKMEENKLKIIAKLKNNSMEPFEPEKVGLQLGIDTYMDSFPEWNNKYFPTLLRCEKKHFWGYFMSPTNRIIGICSPNPVASWSMNYNEVNGYGGHRIYTVNLDILHQSPLPSRHPENCRILLPQEEKQWEFYLMPLQKLEHVKEKLSRLCNAPMLEIDRHTLSKNEEAKIEVFSESNCKVFIVKPNQNKRAFIGETNKDNRTIRYNEFDLYGVYKVYVVNTNGYESEAKIYIRKEWSWYLQQARKEAIRNEQKASTHLESWYGCFSNFLAAKHFPDKELDKKAKKNFDEILPLMYDIKKGEPIIMTKRICNTSCMISLLVDLYEANNDIEQIVLASKLADYLMTMQGSDGAYRTETGWGSGREDSLGEHYTSVIYMAKSMLELAIVEKQLGKKDFQWEERYKRHYQSVKAAIDDLENRLDDIGTEGEHTFEDGMISCSSLQLGMFALLQSDQEEKEKYKRAAEYLIKKHNCLEQTLVPDCRINGCTIRFWEAQYDVMLNKNMINSPHGWTSWKTYATWYLYQLTGKIEYLRQTMDTLGACMQLIDVESGKLRWAFIVDPYIDANVWAEHKGKGIRVRTVIGEDYVDMISGWYKRPKGKVSIHSEANVARNTSIECLPEDGWCCDNDVHEHFKCLEEVALTSAYVYEYENGDIISWNCDVTKDKKRIEVIPYESVVSSIHFNVRSTYDIDINFDGVDVNKKEMNGMFWVNR